jgi:hypothetical protein
MKKAARVIAQPNATVRVYHGVRVLLQRRRHGIFVETNRVNFQAPSGAASSAFDQTYDAPDGASWFCG